MLPGADFQAPKKNGTPGKYATPTKAAPKPATPRQSMTPLSRKDINTPLTPLTPVTPETPPPLYEAAPLLEKGRLKGMKGRGVPDTPARKTAATTGIAAAVAASKKSPTELKQVGSGGRRKLGQPVKVSLGLGGTS